MYELSVTKKVYDSENNVEKVAITISPDETQTKLSGTYILTESADVPVKLGKTYYLVSEDEYTPSEDTTTDTTDTTTDTETTTEA